MTKGTGFFTMELGDYAAPDTKIQEAILKEHGHFYWKSGAEEDGE
jgi:hypothetical protein